jgi:hypothetical protein
MLVVNTKKHRELRSYFNLKKEEKHKCHEEMERDRTEWDPERDEEPAVAAVETPQHLSQAVWDSVSAEVAAAKEADTVGETCFTLRD